jgi:hypothetical protein
MRPDRPSVDELLEAVEEFLRDHAMPALPGHLSFHARVAANVVGIARREITQSDQIEADQLGRLTAMLGHDGTLRDLNRELSGRIRAGDIQWNDAALMDHNRKFSIEELGVDNPRYSAYKKAMEEGD